MHTETENIVTAPNTPAETSDQLQQARQIRQTGSPTLITIGVFGGPVAFVMVCIATLVSTPVPPAASAPSSRPPSRPSSPAAYMLLAARSGKFGGIHRHGRDHRTVPVHLWHFVLSVHRQHQFPGGGRPHRARRQV